MIVAGRRRARLRAGRAVAQVRAQEHADAAVHARAGPRWMCACCDRAGQVGVAQLEADLLAARRAASALELAAGVGGDRRHLLEAGQVGPHLPARRLRVPSWLPRPRLPGSRPRLRDESASSSWLSAYAAPAEPRFERNSATSAATALGLLELRRVAGVLDDLASARPGRCRRSSGRRARSPRRGRPRSPAAGSSSVSSSCQTGSSTPWPARAQQAARARAGPGPGGRGAAPRRAASDWSANSGWRSQTATMSSIGAASIQDASRSSASARAARSRRLLDARPVAPTVTSPA